MHYLAQKPIFNEKENAGCAPEWSRIRIIFLLQNYPLGIANDDCYLYRHSACIVPFVMKHANKLIVKTYTSA